MNEGHAFSFAIKSFSSGKYLKVDGDVASDTLSVSFTGHFNACDTRIRELTSVLLLMLLSSVYTILDKDLMAMYINHNKKRNNSKSDFGPK